MNAERVLIVGGGIAGLSLASALSAAEREVEVVDIRHSWDVTGWGLSLTGPGLRALDSIGLADECIAAGYPISEMVACASDGAQLGTFNPERVAGPDRPAMIGIFRPVLHSILHRAAERSGAQLRLRTTVASIDDNGDEVRVTFSDGGEGVYDLVVGADGVNSRMRSLIGISQTPTFTDQFVWRGLVDRPEWHTCLYTFNGPVHNSGGIPISAEKSYFFVTENDAAVARHEDAELAPKLRELLAAFSGPMDAVRESITSPDQIVRRGVGLLIADLPWHRGRVVLVGDAVHSPSPQLISGSALAIEDAVVLAGLLESDLEIDQILERFGERRYQRCKLVVDTSARIVELERTGRQEEIPAVQGACFAELAQPV